MAEGEPIQNLMAELPDFPPAAFPSIFADGVINVSPGAQVTKLYLFRLDPSLKGNNSQKMQPLAQLVMPTAAFIALSAFMPHMVERLKTQIPELSPLVEKITSDVAASIPNAGA